MFYIFHDPISKEEFLDKLEKICITNYNDHIEITLLGEEATITFPENNAVVQTSQPIPKILAHLAETFGTIAEMDKNSMV